MRTNRITLIWGLILIAAGALFLAQNLGYLSNLTPVFWVIFFAVLSLGFFATYFARGLHHWGWLFPAMVTGGIAITIGLGAAGATGSYVGAPVLGGLVVPFVIAYTLDPQRNEWALIPAWVLGVLTFVTVIADRVPGEVTGALVLFSIGLPFLVVYLRDRRQNWWALIPAGIMLVLGLVPLLSLRISGELLATAIMFLFALPFLVVFFWSRDNWWALIPAGAFVSIGAVLLLVHAGWRNNPGVIAAALFIGLALTFFALWLQRSAIPTAWAKYPAAALGALGVISAGLGTSSLSVVGPLLIIVLGALLLYAAMRRRSM
jgi:hypothetical protein